MLRESYLCNQEVDCLSANRMDESNYVILLISFEKLAFEKMSMGKRVYWKND